ncbi:hypothetical protein EEP06_12570 [Salmonella enterica]|uniref:hypothetical protein n=1 Tax=Escherichia coli TaxID=562 RepID=UPI0005A9A809|nr:hypothetical protein [Escherichia coli]EFC1147503.1 hypothetical protein [Escherichia coli]EIX5024896.1 hypothetical protein [Salmonella enterica]MGW04135.1 hypothetical protein [Salmonella enterica]HCJ7760347.1 hypothetical protein [Citrobacter freundii]
MKTKNMTLYSACFLAGFIAALMSSPVNASEPPPSETRFTVTIKTPSCSISAPPTQSFGELKTRVGVFVNYFRLPEFNVSLKCPGTPPSFVWAEAKRGAVDDGSLVMEVDGKIPDYSVFNSAQLSLLTMNGTAMMPVHSPGTKPESVSVVNGFCSGSGSRDCMLTPQIMMGAAPEQGNALAVITFHIKYL